MPTDTQKQLIYEMPGFAYWLVNEFQIPQTLISKRFGISHLHHPELLEDMEKLSPQIRMLGLIDSYFLLTYVSTAFDVERELQERVGKYIIDKLLSFSIACGTFLS